MPEERMQPEKISSGAEIEALKVRIEQLEAQLKKEEPAFSPEKKEKACGLKKFIKGWSHVLVATF